MIRELAKVRNLIAHGADKVARVVPTAETFAAIKNCQQRLRFLTDGVNIFLKPIREFSYVESLSDALTFMHNHDFSQIIVRKDDRHLSVLTAIDMADWLAGKIKDDIIQLSETCICDVVSNRQSKRFTILSQSSTVADVQREFTNAVHRDYDNLFCVVLTQNGKPTEKALGIVTPWDLIHGRDDGVGHH